MFDYVLYFFDILFLAVYILHILKSRSTTYTRLALYLDRVFLFCLWQEVTGSGFEVLRRIYVDFEGFSLRRKFLTGLEPEIINMMIGGFGTMERYSAVSLTRTTSRIFKAEVTICYRACKV